MKRESPSKAKNSNRGVADQQRATIGLGDFVSASHLQTGLSQQLFQASLNPQQANSPPVWACRCQNPRKLRRFVANPTQFTLQPVSRLHSIFRVPRIAPFKVGHAKPPLVGSADQAIRKTPCDLLWRDDV